MRKPEYGTCCEQCGTAIDPNQGMIEHIIHLPGSPAAFFTTFHGNKCLKDWKEEHSKGTGMPFSINIK